MPLSWCRPWSGEVAGRRGSCQGADGLGHEGLPGRGMGADPSGDVHGSAVDVTCGSNYVAGVETDVKSESNAAGTVVSVARALDGAAS